MKILIVEDDPELRKMLVAQMQFFAGIKFGAKVHGNGGKHPPEICVADNLDDALRIINLSVERSGETPIDAVLCDGAFPTHARRCDEPEGTMTGNWAPVFSACERAGIPFVLLTGSTDLVGKMRAVGHAAFEKPFGCADAVRQVLGDR